MMFYLALTIGTLLAAAGQVMLKRGADGRDHLLAFANGYVLAGLALHGAGMALGLVAMTRLPLHVAYTFTLLSLCFVGGASIAFLGERPNAMAFVGWAIVCLGVGVVTLGAKA